MYVLENIFLRTDIKVIKLKEIGKEKTYLYAF
jgi:hypothetical protein